MRRPAITLACLALAAGGSRGASPDPADLEPTPEVQVKSRALVARLGSDDFAEREEAQKQLAALGRLARPALLRGAGDSPDPEVRRRCAQLLPAATALDNRARVEAFLADAGGDYEHDLPGWKAFRAAACGEWAFLGRAVWSDRSRAKAAREVFAELLAAPENRRLMLALDGSRVELAELVGARRLELYSRRSRGDEEPGREPTLEDATALLFAESFVGSQSPTRRGSTGLMLNASGFYSAAGATGEKGRVYRAVAAAWLRSRDEPREMYMAVGVAGNLDMNDEAADLAARLFVRPGVMTVLRNRAAYTLVNCGGRRHLAALEPLLSSTAVVSTFGTVATEYDIQLRDFALAVSLLLAGEKPADYGFSDAHGFATGGVNGYSLHTRFYFRNDAIRKKAFEKWAAWRKAHAND